MIRPLPRGGAILDLGCGGGEPIDRYLVDQGFAVTGVDKTQSHIDLAYTRFPHHRWIRADIRSVVIEEQFDAVIAWEALTHLTPIDLAAMLTRATAWLKHGGRLLFRAEEFASHGAALAACGLIAMAHTAEACGQTGIWLARKP